MQTGSMVLKQYSVAMRKCDLCHRPTHWLYIVDLDGMRCTFCSGAHASAAANNYWEKKNQGISPQSPEPIENLLDSESDDNIGDI